MSAAARDSGESLNARIHRLAIACFERESANYHRAVAALLAEVADDPEALHELARRGALKTVHDVGAAAKLSVKNAPASVLKLPTKPKRGAEAIKAASGTVARSLLDLWRMPDGRMLGDVTGADLSNFADSDGAKARGFAANAKFYRSLAQMVPEQEIVRRHVNAEKAEDLWRKARAEAA